MRVKGIGEYFRKDVVPVKMEDPKSFADGF